MITQEFNLNLIPQQAPVVVHVSQYDIGGGRLIAHLYEGDTPYTPPSGATATIQGTKPDKIGFQYDDVVLSGSTATANLTEQMCAVAGQTVVNLTIAESDNRTSTFNFVLDVQPAALADDAIISRSDGSILEIPDLVERAEQAAEAAEAAVIEGAEEAEAWATGTKGGQAVPSTDPTYHNNSKYYSEVSGDYVEDSEAWANGTRNGTAVASTDPTYHKNSKYYAEQSDDYSEDSEAWANGTRDGTAVGASDPTYHKNSKYFAEQSDDSAEDSEAYAIGTRDGSTVLPTDPTYHNNAKYYAERAAEIVDEENYVVAVDPTSINPPTAPYLRPSDVVNNLTSTEIDKPLSAYQGKVLKDSIGVIARSFILYEYDNVEADIPIGNLGIEAGAFKNLYIRRDKYPELSGKRILAITCIESTFKMIVNSTSPLSFSGGIDAIEVRLFNPNSTTHYIYEDISLMIAYQST